jgi:hypothetical protein
MSGGGDDSGLFGRDGVGLGRGEFPLDRDGELRKVAVADDPAVAARLRAGVDGCADTPTQDDGQERRSRLLLLDETGTLPRATTVSAPVLEASASRPVGGLAFRGEWPIPRDMTR